MQVPSNESGQVSIHYTVGGSGNPVILLHGWPQHSLMWHTIGPMLSTKYKVYIPDLRGHGGSSIPSNGYDKITMARDILAMIEKENLEGIHLVGYDLGAGVAYSLAALAEGLFKSVVFMEFGLPGFGYEQFMQPSPDWNIGSNWHLSFFTVPEVGEFAMKGKESEMLTWFFWHFSANPEAVSEDHFNEYVRQIKKPGALRAGIEYYAAVWVDMMNNKRLAKTKLQIPVLAIGGEHAFGTLVQQLFEPIGENVQGGVIKEAGHWLGDENPKAVANALIKFFKSV